MRWLILLFDAPESLTPLNDLFVELRHMYRDFGGAEFLEDGICAILETIAPELEEMGEPDRDGVMREIRAIYEKDDSVLKSFMYEPVVEYLCNKDNKIRGGITMMPPLSDSILF